MIDQAPPLLRVLRLSEGLNLRNRFLPRRGGEARLMPRFENPLPLGGEKANSWVWRSQALRICKRGGAWSRLAQASGHSSTNSQSSWPDLIRPPRWTSDVLGRLYWVL